MCRENSAKYAKKIKIIIIKTLYCTTHFHIIRLGIERLKKNMRIPAQATVLKNLDDVISCIV